MAEGFVDLTPEKLQSPDGIAELNRMLRYLFDLIPVDGEKVKFVSGYGTPESNIQAEIGSVYLRLDGGAGTTMYLKESGTGDTGWAGV